MFVRIVAMPTKLLMRFDPEQYRVHESAAHPAGVFGWIGGLLLCATSRVLRMDVRNQNF
jgi:hypothetical protein